MMSLIKLVILLPIALIASKPYRGFHDILTAAGDENGKQPKLVFINYFNELPLSHYPVKKGGASKETPPNKKFLLPPYMFYIIISCIASITIIIAFHLLRRRPIDHSYGTTFNDSNEMENQEWENARNVNDSDRSRLFLYRKTTGHVTTSEKLMATFEKDFKPKAAPKGNGPKDVDLKNVGPERRNLKFIKPSSDDERFFEG